MNNTATVTVYPDGVLRVDIVGKIVRDFASGVTVEDERGLRWTALGDRAQRHYTGPKLPGSQGVLW